MDVMSHIITDRDDMTAFVLAGRAYFTLRNTRTGGRVTYCVERDVDDGFVVRAFTGSDNSDRKSYSYLGHISRNKYVYAGSRAAVDALLVAAQENNDSWLMGFCRTVRASLDAGRDLTPKQQNSLARNIARNKVVTSALPENDIKARGFAWFWRTLNSENPFPEGFEFWHEGRCGKCARRLTVPESIAQGFGPECARNQTRLSA